METISLGECPFPFTFLKLNSVYQPTRHIWSSSLPNSSQSTPHPSLQVYQVPKMQSEDQNMDDVAASQHAP